MRRNQGNRRQAPEINFKGTNQMNELVTYTQDGDIAVIAINNPPVNALSPGVPEGIAAGVERANADATIKGIVLIGGGRTFIAGADIKEFGKVVAGEKEEGSLLPLLLALEDSPKPVVAALHGSAFGGGLEIAMACHYRVADKAAQVGQPEVKLGIIPGAAGTQRLPRLAGVEKALAMCVSGAPVKAADALAVGIVDQLIEGDLLAGASAFLREKIVANARHPKTRERNDKLGDEPSNLAIFAAARESAKKTARGLTAPFAAIDAVEAATKLPFDEGC
jgi:3-hydroxyacyl-CoA dehydrogenase